MIDDLQNLLREVIITRFYRALNLQLIVDAGSAWGRHRFVWRQPILHQYAPGEQTGTGPLKAASNGPIFVLTMGQWWPTMAILSGDHWPSTGAASSGETEPVLVQWVPSVGSCTMLSVLGRHGPGTDLCEGSRYCTNMRPVSKQVPDH